MTCSGAAGGGDTYVYGPGDGDDSIYDHDDFRIATDTLFLTGGLVPADVTVARSAADADDLVIGINGGGSVTVDEMFAGDRTAAGAGRILGWHRMDLAGGPDADPRRGRDRRRRYRRRLPERRCSGGAGRQ